MSSEQGTPGSIQDTEYLSEDGKWFRMTGKGFWHLEAHSEYGVVWSLCGVRMLRAQAETKTRLDTGGGQRPCANCQFKDRQEARKRGE